MSRKVIFSLIFALGLTACGPPSKHEIMKKADGLETKQELEAAIGPPDDVDRIGRLERWSYRTSDGEVLFVIVNDRIRLETTAEASDEP